jgi:hypothetical protein
LEKLRTSIRSIGETAVGHVVGVHEDDDADTCQATVTVVVRVHSGVELVVRPHGRQHQPAFAGIDIIRQRYGEELGPAGRCRPDRA